MSNDKLAEALNSLRLKFTSGNDVPVPEARITRAEWEAIEQAHAAEVAQARAKAPVSMPDVDTMVTRFLSWRLPKSFAPDAGISFKPMPDIYMPHCWPTGTNLFDAGQAKEMILHMLGDDCAAATQPQAAEPVGYVSADILKTFEKGDLSSIRLWRSSDDFAGPVVEVYTHPQPAQAAALYQELLMAVSKKFPNESRHETALRYIKQTELQSCEPKCDAAMAKESGR